jgi:hypothetical protein
MLKSLTVIITIIAITFPGCNSNREKKIDSTILRQTIEQAIAGDYDANVKLHGMISTKQIGKSDYNQLTIDSFRIDKRSYYSVLLEYPDPTLNLFAIYDEDFNLYLLDKSLNGNLSAEWVQMGTRNFVFLQERFLTKDVLSLDRLSIYEVKNNSANLIYRSLSRFVQGNEISYQTIESVTKEFILTKMSELNDKSLDNQPDTFYFNAKYDRYLSKWNLFNTYVKQKIKEFGWVTIKPQIPSDMLENNENVKR